MELSLQPPLSSNSSLVVCVALAGREVVLQQLSQVVPAAVAEGLALVVLAVLAVAVVLAAAAAAAAVVIVKAATEDLAVAAEVVATEVLVVLPEVAEGGIVPALAGLVLRFCSLRKVTDHEIRSYRRQPCGRCPHRIAGRFFHAGSCRGIRLCS